MEIMIAIIGAVASITAVMFGAVYVNSKNIHMQNRKLKEGHYINYFQAIHNLAKDSKNEIFLEEYALSRNKLFIIASEDVVKSILTYENEAVGKASNFHDQYLTNVAIYIRKDLKIRSKNFPTIRLIKAGISTV